MEKNITLEEHQNDALVEPACSEAPITAFITNLGKYNEGELLGEWLPLPTTPEQAKACLKRIGIDGIRYEEYFITDYKTWLRINPYYHLPKWANLDELNYLAKKLDEMTDEEIERFEAMLIFDIRYGNSSLKALINLTENLDCYGDSSSDDFTEIYDGKEIPEEYKVL